MSYITVTIKGLDAVKWRKIKLIAREKNLKVADVVNLAFEMFIEFKKSKL